MTDGLKFNHPYRYRELCNVLKEPYCSGSKQQTQIRKWNSQYDMKKDGREYIIHSELTPEQKKIRELKGAYVSMFNIILSNKLLNTDEKNLSLSMTEILLMTGMINSDYQYSKYNIPSSSLVLDVNTLDFEQYIDKTYGLLNRLVKDMLKTLESKSLIICRKGYKLYKDMGGYTNTKLLDMGGMEERMVMYIESSTLNEMQLESLGEAYQSPYLVKQFKESISKKIKALFPDWDGCFTIYNITLNTEGLKEYNQQLMKDFNEKIKDKILQSSSLKEIKDLDTMVQATIDLSRSFKIKENSKQIYKLQ